MQPHRRVEEPWSRVTVVVKDGGGYLGKLLIEMEQSVFQCVFYSAQFHI